MNSSPPVPNKLPQDWVELYRSEQIEGEALRLAYQRFTARPTEERRIPWERWAFAAALIAVSGSAAYAATGVALQRRHVRSLSVNVMPRHSAAVQHRNVPVAVETGTVARVVDGSATEGLVIANPSAPENPVLGSSKVLLQSVPGTSRHASLAKHKSALASKGIEVAAHEPPAVPAQDTSWQRAAKALRNGDYHSADIALSEIESNGDPRQRESAALSRAQLQIAQGRRIEAVALLRELSQKTHSAVVRTKAEQLLGRLEVPFSPSSSGD